MASMSNKMEIMAYGKRLEDCWDGSGCGACCSGGWAFRSRCRWSYADSCTGDVRRGACAPVTDIAVGLLTSELMLYLLISLAIFTLSFRFLARLQARCQALVARINAQHGLSFDTAHLLGYPAPAFLVFDRQHRKLAACSIVDEAWRIHDFSWLLGWRMTWREVESMEMSGGSRQVNASGMSVPTFERTVRAKNFAIELQTADPQRPVLSFPMSRRAAETWCARLNALFNG